jgi:hypothetical protein
MWSDEHLEAAWALTKGNAKHVLNSIKCACFHCKQVFHPGAIESVIPSGSETKVRIGVNFASSPDDATIMCPHCHSSAVLGDKTGNYQYDNLVFRTDFIDAMSAFAEKDA